MLSKHSHTENKDDNDDDDRMSNIIILNLAGDRNQPRIIMVSNVNLSGANRQPLNVIGSC